MESPRLHISKMSAKDLKSVNWFSKMKAYVKVSLGGDPGTKRRTRVHSARGGNKYRWNDLLSFPIDAAGLNNLYLVFEIKSKRVLGDRDVGRVTVPLKELFDTAHAAAAEGVVEYQVRRPSGDPRGALRFFYKFRSKIAAPVKTIGEMMPYAHRAGYWYPPQPAYGYAPPPYGYAPPPYGYAPPPRMKRWKFGLGLAAWPLGCLSVHGMFSDASDKAGYDAGYGYGDADFDF